MNLNKIAKKNDEIAQQKAKELGIEDLRELKPGIVNILYRYCPLQGFKVYINQDGRVENYGLWVSGETAVKWRNSNIAQLRTFLSKNPEEKPSESESFGTAELVRTAPPARRQIAGY
jgi:hypothetical protein